LNLETVCIAEYKTSMYINIYPFTSDGEQIDDRGQTLTLAQDKILMYLLVLIYIYEIKSLLFTVLSVKRKITK
jgi:hypothetical protein